MERKEQNEFGYRFECRYKGAGLTHYVMQSEDSPF